MGDTLTHVKQAMIKTAHAMLDAKPEGERLLLPALVNKLGDPERKVASRLTHLLGLLVRSHPAMKPLVVAEVQKFVLRPNAPERAQYYACVFLNQLVLTRREAPTAHRLLLVYLSLFGAATRRGDNGGGGDKKGPNLAARLSAAKAAVPKPDSAPLMDGGGGKRGGGKGGAKAAAPAAAASGAMGTGCSRVCCRAFTARCRLRRRRRRRRPSWRNSTLFRVAHAPSFGTAVQALMVLGQLSA